MTSLGVEYGCKYTLTGPDGTIVVFNDSTDKDFVGILSPESSGLDSPDVREDATDATEEDGGHHGDFFYGRRPVILQGTIIANSAEQRNERATKLQQASNALREDATLKWKPAGAAEEVELKLRRQQPFRMSKGYVKDFQIPLVSADAFISGTSEITHKNILETGETVAKTFESVAAGALKWENTSNAAKSDNVYAVAGPSGGATTSHDLVARNFGFVLPKGAKIIGLKGMFERKRGGVIEDASMKLWKSGAPIGTSQGIGGNWPSSDTVTSFGGKTNLWGLPELIATDAENSSFGWAARCTFSGVSTAFVDLMNLNIYYQVIMEVINEGTYDAPFVVRLIGPHTNPTITDGENFLGLSYTINSGHYIDVNFGSHTIIEDGITNRYNALDFEKSNWWHLPSNATSSIEVATGEAEVHHINAYL